MTAPPGSNGAPALVIGEQRSPRRDRFVARQRLLRRLAGERAPVVVLAAPAGSGKSIAVEQWVARDPRRSGWVGLRKRHDDPSLLAATLLGALRRLSSSPNGVDVVATAREPAFSAVVLPTLERLASAPLRPYLLVLDDVQHLTDPAAHLLLQTLAEAVPDGSTVVLVTRSEAAPWLSRSRVEGRLVELGPDDLAMDRSEARQLFHSQGLELTTHEAATLVDLTEGWPVGLYLLALARKRRGEQAGVQWTVAPTRLVSDYLHSEVLDLLDGESRQFMRRTAMLGEFTAAMSDAVLERVDSAAILERLHRQFLLVVALDGSQQRYRYHHLLRSALLTELRHEEPELLVELHARASRWYELHDEVDDAIRHAKAAGDLDRTGALAWAYVLDAVGSARTDRLAQWLGDLDEPQIRAHGQLCLAAAWLAVETADATGLRRWLLAAEATLSAGWTEQVPVPAVGSGLAILLSLVGDGGPDEMLRLCRLAGAALPPDSLWRAAAASLEGIALGLLGRTDEAEACLVAGARLARSLRLPLALADMLSTRGLLAIQQGQWDRGVELILDAGREVHQHHLDHVSTGAYSVSAWALALARQGDRELAGRTLGVARRLTADVHEIAPWFAVLGRILQARTAMMLADHPTARLLLSEARTLITPEQRATTLGPMLEEAAAALHTVDVGLALPTALTTAELRVLQFLPSHLTFPQIGDHLYLSRHTVKTHAMSVYRKLGVDSRGAAVDRARLLGLVEAVPVD